MAWYQRYSLAPIRCLDDSGTPRRWGCTLESLSPEDLLELHAWIATSTVKHVAEDIQITTHTLSKVLAGFPVRTSTAAYIRHKIATRNQLPMVGGVLMSAGKADAK